jgi:hypothetical protein
LSNSEGKRLHAIKPCYELEDEERLGIVLPVKKKKKPSYINGELMVQSYLSVQT